MRLESGQPSVSLSVKSRDEHQSEPTHLVAVAKDRYDPEMGDLPKY